MSNIYKMLPILNITGELLNIFEIPTYMMQSHASPLTKRNRLVKGDFYTPIN
jgi:hypothetical protein